MGKANNYSSKFKQTVVRDYLTGGMGINELSKKYDVSKSRVSRWIQEAGVEPVERVMRADIVYNLQNRIAKLENENRFQKQIINYLILELAHVIKK